MTRRAPVIKRAEHFARSAHASVDHRRKHTGEPYIMHPEAVAKMVEEHGGDANMIAAAWLHDVVEDTPITSAEIVAEFGDDIAKLVAELTNYPKHLLPRPERMEIDFEKHKTISHRAKTIRLADVIHNVTGIVESNAEHAKRLLPEKLRLLRTLTDGNLELVVKANAVINDEIFKLSKLDEGAGDE